MLKPAALRSHEARRQWAKRKSRALAQRCMDLETGAPTKTQTPFEEAITSYLQDAGNRLRPSTLGTYRQGIDRFRRWAHARGIAHFEAVTPTLLAELRAAIVAGGRQVVQKGGRRGARTSATSKREAVTTNTYLTSIKILLNHFRVRGLVPGLSKDAIGDTLKPLPLPRGLPPFLAPAQIDKLLRAALRHDADVFKLSRAEKANRQVPGTTRRYEPVAAFIATLLLAGLRRGEALALEWRDVDLDAIDSAGHVVGELQIRPEVSKTHRARVIGLEVSPALRRLLSAMRLEAGKGADNRRVFDALTVDALEAARDRLVRSYGAPRFDWQMLRSTCSTYLTNAPGIFGAAAAFMSAKMLGHSVTVAERSYAGLHRGVAKDARTLEAAMQIEDGMREVLANAASAASTLTATISAIA